MGYLGSVIVRCLSVNGFQVLGWSCSVKNMVDVEIYSGEVGLMEVFCCLDILVLFMLLIVDIRGFLNEVVFVFVKLGVVLINFVWGFIIEIVVFFIVLDRDQVSYVVFDVFDEELLLVDYLFWDYEKIMILLYILVLMIISIVFWIVVVNIGCYFIIGEIFLGVDCKWGY